MGPRSFDRGNVACLGCQPNILDLLQWGRDLLIAEMNATRRDVRLASSGASMGPRSFDRGNAIAVVPEPMQLSSFNGAAIF